MEYTLEAMVKQSRVRFTKRAIKSSCGLQAESDDNVKRNKRINVCHATADIVM